MIIIINEYILILNGVGEIFRVYSPNEKMAINVFQNACKNYSCTENNNYKEYWDKLNELINQKQYTLVHSEDFIGIRKI